MHDRLTIVRPEPLGDTFADAVSRVCDLDLAISQQHLTRLDARLGCGDFESVTALIRAAGPVPALPIFIARYVRWSGDLQSADAAWDAVLASIPLIEDDVEQRALRAALVELAPIATDLGHAQFAAHLHRIARQTPGPSPATAADASGINDSDANDSEVGAAEADASGVDASDVDAGEVEAIQVDASEVDASIVRTVVEDMLGVDPDATRGRLRLRPRLDRLDELEVRGIRFADGSVSLSASHSSEARQLVLRVEQGAGAIPFTVLLEPVVAMVGAARVDGQPADLEPQPFDGAWMVPVQLVLDDIRTLALSTVPAAAEPGDHSKTAPRTRKNGPAT